MKQNIQLFHPSRSLWSRFLNLNPQFFREIKGKLKTRNVVLAAAISVIVQFMVVISRLSELPNPDPQGIIKIQEGRYGLGDGYHNSLAYTKDLLGNWVINWQLLWLDLLLILSVIGIFSLLVIGTYMLTADLVKEESRGTLNFIRLTPQSAGSICLGKILGVPILLYVAVLLMLPLHLAAAWGAQIPLALCFAFYGVIIASCALVYSGALLVSLINSEVSSFKPWLASGGIGFLLFIFTTSLFHSSVINGAIWDWFCLFNPAIALTYLIDSTYLPESKISFLSVENLGELLFYGQALWTKASFGIGFILFNFSLGTYWCWSILQRRFHNPHRTLVSKSQSYWITGWFVFMALGFTLQQPRFSSTIANFSFLQLCICALGLGLIAALSPHRQTLYDWARYRHQVSHHGKVLWKELIFGENSPSIVAVAINMAIAIIYITPSLFFILERDERYIFWGFVLSGLSIVFYNLTAQLLLTLKTRKRAMWSTISVANLIILLPLTLGLTEVIPQNAPQLWLWSFIPTVAVEFASISQIILAIFGQCLAISVLGFYLTRKLQQAGASETKILMESIK